MSSSSSWHALESDPDLWQVYVEKLGVNVNSLDFIEIYSLDEDYSSNEAIFSYIFLYPDSGSSPISNVSQPSIDDKLWTIKQIDELDSCCCLIALLHAIGNNLDKVVLEHNSPLAKFFEKTKTMTADERAIVLLNDTKIHQAHEETAEQGQTEMVDSGRVGYHYIAYILSNSNKLYELNGSTKGPQAKFIGELNNESFFSRMTQELFSLGYPLILLIIALVISYLHFSYIYELFENDKRFSHLSTLERELSFRTEMGLYYSYFKQIAIDSTSFIQGFLSIISDNRTEAPTTINVLERFNLYPEVLISLIYRLMNSQGMLTEVCYQIDRGETMTPVLSCEGHKEPTYFYVTSVFILNGLLLGILFLFGTYLSKSILGGIITTFAYVFNHGEATRVMWTPPLRESFSFPFHVLQLFVVTYVLQQQQTLTNTNAIKSFIGYIKKHDQSIDIDSPQNLISYRHKIKLLLLLIGSTILYMLPWQFAQFTLATQLLSLGLLYILNLLPFEQFFFILCAQILSLIISAVLMFGNRMLLTSLFSITLFSFYL
ncbi:unnamed protein product, partial [Rotaria sp. Silwood2]